MLPLLKGVKGIGEKTAQRIIVDLKGKIGKLALSSEFLIPSSNNILKEEALSALVMLGFNKAAADKALDKILKTEGTATNSGTTYKICSKKPLNYLLT